MVEQLVATDEAYRQYKDVQMNLVSLSPDADVSVAMEVTSVWYHLEVEIFKMYKEETSEVTKKSKEYVDVFHRNEGVCSERSVMAVITDLYAKSTEPHWIHFFSSLDVGKQGEEIHLPDRHKPVTPKGWSATKYDSVIKEKIGHLFPF